MKKKTPLFYKIFFSVCAFALAALVTAALFLRSALVSFEASRPVHQAKDAFERYFAAGDFLEAVKLSGAEAGDFEGPEELARYLEELCQGKELRFYSVSSTEDEEVYAVVAGEFPPEPQETTETEGTADYEAPPVPKTYKIATMLFRKAAEKGSWGFFGYEFAGLEIAAAGTKSVAVTVPEGSVLTLNGKKVPETYLTETKESEWNRFLPEGVKGLSFQSYEVGGLFFEPVIACADSEGRENPLSYDEESGRFATALNFSEALQKEYADYVLAGAKAYAAYIQNDGSLAAVAKYFDTASTFYYHIRTNPGSFVWEHSGYRFENEKADSFYAYDENTFSCRVSFTHVLTKAGAADYRDGLDMILFLKKVGGTYRIYERMINS